MKWIKRSEVRRFLDEDVVGQLRNGLFFEASVKQQDGEVAVVENGERGIVDSSEIKWLATAQRYC